MITKQKTDKQSVFSFEKITDGISINVTPVFVDQESRPDDHFYLWAYQVRIENQGKTSVKILDREWSIVDGRGMRKTITGTGVFEGQPTLNPGDAFQYTNTIPLSTTYGLISGKYAMEVPQGKILEIETPVFSLDSPYGSKLLH